MYKLRNLYNVIVRISTTASGAAVGSAIGGPLGAAIGAAYGDVAERWLSQKERTRVEKVIELAQAEVKKKLANGIKPKVDLSSKEYESLVEGTLIASRSAFEEKKLPLMANLIAAAAFTNTPLENNIEALSSLEQMSFRKICILAIIGANDWMKGYNLSIKAFREEAKSKMDEYIEGVYDDILSLINQGFLMQITQHEDGAASVDLVQGRQWIVPANLYATYPSRLLYNGARLDQIEESDIAPVLHALSEVK